MENSTEFPQKTKNRLPYDPAIPLVDIYPKKMKTLIWKDTCIPTFIAALFIITKIWKQPKCPLTNDNEEVVYTHTHTHTHTHNGILLSHKKEWNSAICNNMDGPRKYYC